MQVTQEPLDPCQVALTIEVEQDKVVHAVDKAYREYAKYVNVPGFRKGKAPMSFVRQRVPESDVRQRTAELLVEPAYAEAIRDSAIEPVAPPRLELLQLELHDKPFIFKAVVPLAPVVTLGEYKQVAAERKIYPLTDDTVLDQIQRMQDRAAEYPIAERPCSLGDLLIAKVTASVDGETSEDARPTMIELNENNIPGFNDQVTGLSAGDTKSFALTYPDDYTESSVAGKDVDFTLEVTEIRSKIVPELNDELAKKITNGQIDTLDAFKSQIREDMQKQLEQNSNNELEMSIVDKILESSTVNFPPQYVDNEVEREAQDLMARLEREKVPLENYMQQVGKTQEQLVADMQEGARKRISVGLLLGKIFETEDFQITDEDVNSALQEQAEQQRTSPAAIRAYLEANNGMDTINNRARTKKVLDFLTSSAIISDTEVTATTGVEGKEATPDEVPATAKKSVKKSVKSKASDPA